MSEIYYLSSLQKLCLLLYDNAVGWCYFADFRHRRCGWSIEIETLRLVPHPACVRCGFGFADLLQWICGTVGVYGVQTGNHWSFTCVLFYRIGRYVWRRRRHTFLCVRARYTEWQIQILLSARSVSALNQGLVSAMKKTEDRCSYCGLEWFALNINQINRDWISHSRLPCANYIIREGLPSTNCRFLKNAFAICVVHNYCNPTIMTPQLPVYSLAFWGYEI